MRAATHELGGEVTDIQSIKVAKGGFKVTVDLNKFCREEDAYIITSLPPASSVLVHRAEREATNGHL